ncbi:MAG: phosphopyruvate hydratase [Patescibacteria group bacterium]
MAKIKKLLAQEILDSRGFPTIAVTVVLDNGISAIASSPSSVFVAPYAARELRDGDKKRYGGQGMRLASQKVEDLITTALVGKKIDDQAALDQILLDLDGTPDKHNLGANTILAVSVACARAGAQNAKQELFVYLNKIFALSSPRIPIPIFCLFNGGRYGDTNLDFQEFLIIPKKSDFSEMLRLGSEIFQELGDVLDESGYDTDTGSEGGYAPDLDSSIEALEFILAAGTRVGRQPGVDFSLGLNIGSSILYEESSHKYLFALDNAYFSAANLVGLYEEWLKKYPLSYLEDALADEDWSAWRELTAEFNQKMIIAAGDVFASNIHRLREGLKEKAANSIVIKPLQIGTLTEIISCCQLAQKHNYKVILSHSSGETNDDFLADLAVALNADYIKAGAPSRGERIVKYNRLLTIASLLKNYEDHK